MPTSEKALNRFGRFNAFLRLLQPPVPGISGFSKSSRFLGSNKRCLSTNEGQACLEVMDCVR